ncbi:hypothetical protein LTR37_014466 [Vermiconidia calcicola]|uniref:Uncharacterized protein n=1 Tax=Vermiconidia calcicola TaxID=1690605 RepID=A0ACC3MUX4_9PEZI|nr:hypothetical protein LTR37_014466 [Vermiconidia calcicola]
MRHVFFNRWTFDVPEGWFNRTEQGKHLCAKSQTTLHGFFQILGNEAMALRQITVTINVSKDVTEQDVKEALEDCKGVLHKDAVVTIHIGWEDDPRYKWCSCKRRSGGLASYAFIIPDGEQKVTITGDTHITHNDNDTASGKPMLRSMCSNCGSPVRIIEGSSPDTWCMQYGLFADEVDLPPPKLEMFRSKACAWEAQVGEKVMETQ